MLKQAWRGLAIGSLVVLGLGCGDDPVPMTGRAFWREGCTAASASSCTANSHSVSGSNGSPTVIVSCNVAPGAGGTRVSFQIAAIERGQNFEESQEALFATGLLTGAGAELRSADDENGFVQVRGSGWAVRNASIGVVGNCHVFIERINGQSFNGKIKCDGITDDLTPPRTRYLAGLAPQTADNEFGEFSFTNCDNR